MLNTQALSQVSIKICQYKKKIISDRHNLYKKTVLHFGSDFQSRMSAVNVNMLSFVTITSVERESLWFELKLRRCVHFNTLGENMNAPYSLPSNGLNSITTVLLQGWIWH